MNFTKLHSLGNDFLVVEIGDEFEECGTGKSAARRICDRHTGVGADGMLLLRVEDKAASRVSFRIFNADGTEAEISGNGLRCAAAYLFWHKKVDGRRILFLTPAGERSCELVQQMDTLFETRIDLGIPRFASPDIPFDDGRHHEKLVDYPLCIGGKVYDITCISIGNPHCDIFVDNLPARLEWKQVCAEIESHPFFPNRTNVEFIRVLNRGEIKAAFWERGVGETLSSGTGSCAAAVASMIKGLTDRKVKVRTDLGELTVEWPDERIFQSGPAEIIFDGRTCGM